MLVVWQSRMFAAVHQVNVANGPPGNYPTGIFNSVAIILDCRVCLLLLWNRKPARGVLQQINYGQEAGSKLVVKMRVVLFQVTDNLQWQHVAKRAAARARRLMSTFVSTDPAATARCRRLAAKIPLCLVGDPDATTIPEIDELMALVTMTFMDVRDYAISGSQRWYFGGLPLRYKGWWSGPTLSRWSTTSVIMQ